MLQGPKTKAAFPSELRFFATTLHFYSPKAYDYVRKSFFRCLPHPGNISKWYQKVNCSSGINNLSIEAIKKKVERERAVDPEKVIFCNLVMDEMKVKKHIDLCGDKEYGYIDIGKGVDSESIPEAENAFVLMAVCVNGDWKIPVSFYFVNALTATEKAEVVNNNLIALHPANIILISITFDGLKSNLTMCKALGADLSHDVMKNYFLHPITGDKVFINLDACHGLKLL